MRLAAATGAIVWTAVCVAAQAPDRSIAVRLGAQGDLLAWLVAGPFPDPGAFQLKGRGFSAPFPVERELTSRESYFVAVQHPAPWRLLLATRSRGLDLAPLFGGGTELFAYCAADLIAPRDESVQLLFGSDDGAKVFLNGREVFSKEVPRGVRRDEDRVVLALKSGRNHLLFKIEQLNQGWGLMARLVRPDGHPATNVHEELALTPSVHDAYRDVRALAGTKGALDIETMESYRQLFAKASRWSAAFLSSESHPASPQAKRELLEALRNTPEDAAIADDADAASTALQRANDRLSAAFNRARAPWLKWAQEPGPLWPGPAETEDFIRVMPGGRYFVDQHGRPFTPIGYNHNPDWTELDFGDPLRDRYDPSRVDRWFANLEAHRINLIRLMVETPPSGNLEERPGVFRPEHVVWLDTVMSAAKKHGVRVWMTPYDTFWMSKRADASPYWAANGGPIDKPIDFLTKPDIIDLQKRRMKWLIDRYGNSGTVFAWEIMNEIDIWWGASPEQIKAWTNQVAAFVRGYQKKRWSRDHLVTLSFADPETKGLNAETQFRRRDLDFATMHLYLGASRSPKPGQPRQAADDFASGVRYARSQIRDNRPVMDGESGPIDHWIDDALFDDEVFHLMSWAHLLSGGAGAGTRWPYRNPHHLTPGMLHTLRVLRDFSDAVPWRALNGPEVATTLEGFEGEARVFATTEAAIVWVRGSGSVHLHWPGGRVRRFGVLDVATGRWASGVEPFVQGDRVTISVPAQTHEAAIWLRR